MRVLVTGGCGFIGSNLVRIIRHQRPDWTVVNLDKCTYAGNPANLSDLVNDPNYVFACGDIANRELVSHLMTTHAIDGVIHLAAESHVDRSILGPELFTQTNVAGTAALLEASRQQKIRRFVMVSTDEVYGSLGASGYFTETTPLAPSSPYSASKAGADLLALAYHHTFGLDVVVTRCSNNYGPFQLPEKLIPLMITNALDDKPLPVYGDGKNVRDWLHVEDHCEAILTAFEKGRAGEVYNIGGNSERTNIEVVRALLKIVEKPDTLIQYVKDRPGHDRRYAIDATKIKAELGWQPRHRFEAGLAATARWYMENRAWCEAARARSLSQFFEQQYGSRLQSAR
jgi:dTDP-glucose 4,6-dehydratase